MRRSLTGSETEDEFGKFLIDRVDLQEAAVRRFRWYTSTDKDIVFGGARDKALLAYRRRMFPRQSPHADYYYMVVTRSYAISYNRKYRPGVVTELPQGDDGTTRDIEDLVASSDDLSDTMVANLDLQRCLGKLTPHILNLIQLRFIQGYTIQEVGQMTGTPWQTENARINRALEQLRRCMTGGEK